MTPEIFEATRLWTLAVPVVSAFITSLVRDFPDRDDVLQETAVAVLESFSRYDPAQSFVGWAIGIARNQVRLHFRRKSRDRIAFDSEVIDALANAFAEQPPHDIKHDRLGECFDALDYRSKELCRLRYEQDLKPAMIGKKVGMAPNAVAKALQRVRDRLRECIEHKAREVDA
ncbi:MAG: sigma-70 family RNA polymerase sigma factor [Zavarzinella sp.]